MSELIDPRVVALLSVYIGTGGHEISEEESVELISLAVMDDEGNPPDFIEMTLMLKSAAHLATALLEVVGRDRGISAAEVLQRLVS